MAVDDERRLRANRLADTSTIAPFDYMSLLFGIAIGFFLFGEVPTRVMLVGAAIVVAAGIFIIFREHRLGLGRARVGRWRRRVDPRPHPAPAQLLRSIRGIDRFQRWAADPTLAPAKFHGP